MRLTYDAEVDAAYVYLVLGDEESHAQGVAVRTEELFARDPSTMINADFDRSGVLIGFEVIGASRLLDAKTIAAADPLA